MPRRPFVVQPAFLAAGVFVFLLSFTFGPALARDFLIGKWNDDEIREHVAELIGFVADRPEGETALCLNRSYYVGTSHREYKVSENREYYVYDQTAEELATQRLTFSRKAEMKELEGWILRDGAVLRLGDDDILWREGNDERIGEAVFHFPNFQKGDVFGLSYRYHRPGNFPGDNVTLALEHPVASGHFYLKTKGETAYRMTVRNLTDDQISVRTGEEKNGAPTLMVADYRSIPPLQDTPFQMPAVRRTPYLDFIRVARLEEWKDVGSKVRAWLRVNSWNHQAMYGRELADSFVDDKRVRAKTEELVADQPPGESVAQALFDFVRLNISERSSQFGNYFEVSRDAREILEEREASANEKCLLLHAMMQAAGLSSNVGFLRSHHLGSVDTGSPDITQLPELAVYHESREGNWLWPVHLMSEPGALPPWLRRSTAFVPGYELEERFDKLQEDALLESGNALRQFQKVYHRRLDEAKWYSFVETTGDPFEVFGTCEERLTFDLEAGRIELSVGFRGSALPDGGEVRGDTPLEREFVTKYVESRWPDMLPDATKQFDHRISFTDSLVTITATLPAWELPPSSDGVWILPGAALYGGSRLDEWSGPDRGPMFIDCGEEYRYRTRVPIPEGWESVALPEGLRMVNPRVAYEATFSVDGGFLVVDRHLAFRAGVTPEKHLTHMDADLQEILAFESQPIVLESFTAGSR